MPRLTFSWAASVAQLQRVRHQPKALGGAFSSASSERLSEGDSQEVRMGGRMVAIVGEVKASEMSTISRDNAVDGRARAEQESGNLSGRTSSGTKQQDVQSEQVTVASVPELRKHLVLLEMRNIEYGRVGHSLFSETNRVFDNNRFIKECLSVPISYGSI